jgi:hypothetical protein
MSLSAKAMVGACANALALLTHLEGALAQFEDAHDATVFMYRARAHVLELQAIAMLETSSNVTVQQAAHIAHICAQARQFLRSVPKTVRRDPGNELL